MSIPAVWLCMIGGLHVTLLLHIAVVIETVAPFVLCVACVVVLIVGLHFCMEYEHSWS